MKHLLLSMLIALPCVCAVALAEPAGPPMGPPFEELDLSDAQRSQIRQIIEQTRERSAPLARQMRELHRQTHSQIEALLTPEQRQRLQQARAERCSGTF